MTDTFESTLGAFTRRVLSDLPPARPFDYLLLVGQTADNERSVLNRAARYSRDNRGGQWMNPHLLIVDGPTGFGFPGFPRWEANLRQQGVNPENIVRVSYSNPERGINTNTEMQAFLDYLLREVAPDGAMRLGIIAAPFHQPRAFVNFVSVALMSGTDSRMIDAFSVPGDPLPMDEVVAHSQGITRGMRADLVRTEAERIRAYTAKGDLLPIPEIIAYMDERDARNR
jgi:hypothetical protein